MVWLTQTRLDGLGRAGMVVTIGKLLIASAAMGLVAFAVVSAVEPNWLKVVAPTAAGMVVYIALLWLLRVREAERVWEMARARLGRV